jgi:spermidine synthase
LSVNHADGRRYLNTSKENFDIIILDAFGNNISIPFHLITEEALKEVARLLKPGGLVLQNVVASLEGDGSEVTRLIARTYEQVFSHLSVYQIDSKIPTNDI